MIRKPILLDKSTKILGSWNIFV